MIRAFAIWVTYLLGNSIFVVFDGLRLPWPMWVYRTHQRLLLLSSDLQKGHVRGPWRNAPYGVWVKGP